MAAYVVGNLKVTNVEGFTEYPNNDPKNYHVLKSLSETKIKLDKLNEAKALVEQILAMPGANGRDILVFQTNRMQPQEAELVDENVLAIAQNAEQEDLGKTSKYVIRNEPDPTPHFRVYLKKSGEMKLLPHTNTRIEYTGIPEATRKLSRYL